MTTVTACEVLLEYAGAALWARVRLRGNLVLSRQGGTVQVRAETPLVEEVDGIPKLVGIKAKTIQDGEPLLKIVDGQLWHSLTTR